MSSTSQSAAARTGASPESFRGHLKAKARTAVGGYEEEGLVAEHVQFLLDLKRLGRTRGRRPVAGKANRELVTLIARHLGCAKSAVTIKSGASGRVKLVRIEE